MIRIAAEEAWAPKEILERYRKLLADKPEAWDPGFRSLWGFFLGSSERATALVERIQDLGERRIADMDATGIARQLVFLTAPGVQVFDPANAASLSWAANDQLVEKINATHVGAEMDPSHLFWQGIDPTEAVRSLGDLVYNAAAKDTRINPLSKVNGNLDDSFSWVTQDDPKWLSLGGPHSLSGWPAESSWDFVAVGRGHDLGWWAGFLDALRDIDAEMAVNIEHEDQELDQMEGLRYAADTLLQAARAV